MTPITLITMAQGNILALKRTVGDFKNTGIINEVIFGDMLIFEDDRERMKEMAREYESEGFVFKVLPLPFNFIFKYGFAATLNRLAAFANNDMVLYMNVGEIIDKRQPVNMDLLNQGFHSFYFNHATETHKWVRCYNRKFHYWSGVIHEVVIPYGGFELNTCPEPFFMMADTEKDMEDPFKAKVFNDIKELVYFNQYIKLVEHIEMCGATNSGWVQFAQQDYNSFKERLAAKGLRYWAFKNDEIEAYLQDTIINKEFELEHQESTKMVNLQGKRHDIL